jgi:hypothetical protein
VHTIICFKGILSISKNRADINIDYGNGTGTHLYIIKGAITIEIDLKITFFAQKEKALKTIQILFLMLFIFRNQLSFFIG